MITTDFVPGSACWLDLGAPDVAAAADFYGSVFGWQFQSLGPETGDYGLCQLNGRTVGAIGSLTEEGARSAWMIYFVAPDAEETTRATERAGGEVRVAPLDIGEGSRMAQLTDPQGAQFAVMQPGKNGGLEAVDQPGALCWIELYTTDVTEAKTFYGSLFGWGTEDMPLPQDGGGTYSIITPAGHGRDRMQGGMMQLSAKDLSLTSGRPYWHPVFAVEDCDATAASFTRHGGSVQMGPQDEEGVGRLAVCLDPSGADCVVLTPAQG